MRSVVLAGVLAAVATASACARPPVPDAAPTRAGGTGCATCHAEIAAEWAASFHHTAFTDATFQASLAMEAPKDRAFCTGCHAPRGTAEAGVDCASCHGRAFDAPHARGALPTTVAARVASCAPCHEFTFGDGRPELVQKTVSEHAASAHADVACPDCHMPKRGGHRDHRFVAGHAPERVRGAVEVAATRAGPRSLRVTIRSATGHAFPTGDMFRRVRLQVFAEGTRGEILADAERAFERTWSGVDGDAHPAARTQTSDSRIAGRWEEVVELDAASPIARVRWQLHYDRVLAARGEQRVVVSSDLLHEGEVAW